MRLLVIDAASGAALAAVTEDTATVAEAVADSARALPALVAGLPVQRIDAVGVVVGPGSFTGLRTALSFAEGFARARGVALAPVGVAEALGEALPHRGGRSLWVALDSRRDWVFLDRGAGMAAVDLAGLVRPDRPVMVAGDKAREVAAVLAARGADVMLSDARHARPRDIAAAALRRLKGDLPPLAAAPLYVDPPAVSAA